MKIFVMHRGYVLVGEETRDKDDWMFYELRRCATVRRWGTTQGLGQLAMAGPSKETILDAEPDGTRINILSIDREIPCNSEAWKKWINS